MNGDTELLRRYVEDRSEAAFTELVRQHLNFVYFAALRQVGGDAHRAQDVAQAVFTDLACKAPALIDRSTLTGWLHTSTRFAAAKVRRAAFSRQRLEQEATSMNALLHESDPAAEWERLRPMIDDVIHELDDRDREAVLLRFFEGRPFAEIGAALRLSEDAARMRVDRALDKLRARLAHRGVKSTGAALATVFASQAGATVPASVGSMIAAVAFAEATGNFAVVGLGLFMSKTTTAILGVVALAAIGSTFFQWSHAQRAEAELDGLRLDRDNLHAQLRVEQQRAARVTQDVTLLQGEVQSLKARQTPPMPASRPPPAVAPVPAPAPATALGLTSQEYQQIRRSSMNKAMMNNLRQVAAARDQFILENGRPPTSLQELVGEDKLIKRLVPVYGEDYATVSLLRGQPLTVTDTDGVAVTYDPTGPNRTSAPSGPIDESLRARVEKFTTAMNRALDAYRTANNGKTPPNPEGLLPYFATPQEGADFVEMIEAQKAGKK